jgi:hypothetical protein
MTDDADVGVLGPISQVVRGSANGGRPCHLWSVSPRRSGSARPKVGQHQDVEQLRAGSGREGVETLL